MATKTATKPTVRKRRQPAKKTAAKRSLPEPRKRYTGKPGRPTLLTPKVTKEILDAVRQGLYVEHAVKAAGVSPSTYYAWAAKARAEIERLKHEEARLEALRSEGLEPDEPEPMPDPEVVPYLEFLEALDQAESEGMRWHVRNLQRIARSKSDLSSAARASLNIMERRWPRLWSRAERSEVTVSETSVSYIEVHTVEEQKERTRETLGALLDAGAVDLVGDAIETRALPAFEEDEDDD